MATTTTTTTLPTRTLGRNGPSVPALGLGCMGLSAYYGPVKPDSERLAFLDRAYELGLRFWDTADIYGDSEELLGRWFRERAGKRGDVFLATKFAINKVEEGNGVRGDRAYVLRACERSLNRLGVDYIDLYYMHRPDPETPIEETIGALLELKAAGKIKHIGLSECSAATLRRAAALTQIAAYQVEYSPFFTDIEAAEISLLSTARELGVAIVPYSPLGRGLLTGKYRSPRDFAAGDFRRMLPRYSEENFPRLLEVVDALAALAAARPRCSVGQLTLAWVLAQGDDFVPLFGTTSVRNLEENLAALEVRLSELEEREIRSVVDKASLVGARYPEAMSKGLFGDSAPKKD